ncbi:MAG: hypothetical protein M3619_25600 [Myxococcota bacterium]|nr:hypothetical protein [Myxococcota bacterium]
MNGLIPPWHRDHAQPHRERQPQSSSFRAWRTAVEAQLTAGERAYLQRCISKMPREQRERLARLTPDQAVAELRREMPRSTYSPRYSGTKGTQE